MKRLNLQTVDRPQVDIECAGRVIQSTVIANARRNPNFQHPVDFFDVVCDNYLTRILHRGTFTTCEAESTKTIP